MQFTDLSITEYVAKETRSYVFAVNRFACQHVSDHIARHVIGWCTSASLHSI